MVDMAKNKRKSFIKSFLGGLILFGISIGVIVSGAMILWIATLKIPNLDTFHNR